MPNLQAARQAVGLLETEFGGDFLGPLRTHAAGTHQNEGAFFVIDGFAEAGLQHIDGDIFRANQMPSGELLWAAHINNMRSFSVDHQHRLGGGQASLTHDLQGRQKQRQTRQHSHQNQHPVIDQKTHHGCLGNLSQKCHFRMHSFFLTQQGHFLPMYTLVLIRHGESVWNLENRFTGWADVDLTPTGVAQARRAGEQLKEAGFDFDVAYTSVLKRAIHTLWHVLDGMDRTWLPVTKDWRLNERHYGALQGLNKAETAEKYGDAQVMAWRRSFDVPPPALQPSDIRYEGSDRRYAKLSAGQAPLTECLKDTVVRVMPFWNESLAPAIRSGQRVLLSAHGNSLRALVKYLDNIADQDIVGLNIPNGEPLVYELDADLRPIRRYYLNEA